MLNHADRQPDWIAAVVRSEEASERLEAVMARAAPDLPCIHRDGARRLFARTAPTVWPEGMAPRLFVIGRPLSRSGTTGLNLVAGHEADPTTIAHALLEGYWGSFVALLPTPGGWATIREPSGAAPAWIATGSDIDLIAPELPGWAWTALDRTPQIRWDAVAAVLARPPIAAHLPLLADVTSPVPGKLHHVGGPGERVAIWSPAAVARTRDDRAFRLLPSTLDTVIDALVGNGRPALQLSGGLDSSIVLAAALSKSPIAINFATRHAGGDERRYAREAAAFHGVPLIELSAGRSLDYARLFTIPHAPSPFLHGLDDVFESGMEGAAMRDGATLILTGQGGDALFFEMPTPSVLVDRLVAGGRLVSSETLDDAVRAGRSLPGLLAAALVAAFRRGPEMMEAIAPHLLTPAARAAAETAPDHPWLATAGRLPPAKRLQLLALANAQLLLGPRAWVDTIRLAHPLLSRPIVDAAIATPIPTLVYGVQDRAGLRRLFADRVPAGILARSIKGEAGDHYAQAAIDNLEMLRDRLLDGVLVAEGVLDRTALDRALRPDHLAVSLDYRAVQVQASLEAWARYWKGAYNAQRNSSDTIRPAMSALGAS